MTIAASGERRDNAYYTSEIEWSAGDAAHPHKGRRSSRPAWRWRLPLLSFILSGSMLAGLAAMVAFNVDPIPDEAGRQRDSVFVASPTPAIDALEKAPAIWTEIVNPEPLLQLRTLELLSLPMTYAQRSHGLGGAEDSLTFGQLQDSDLHLYISAYRMGGEAPASSTFFVDLVRRAAEAGIGVTGMELPEAVATKFGMAETAEATLTSGDSARLCRAFRVGDGGLSLTGWACDSSPVTADEITCFLDNLSLTPAGAATALAASFNKASGKRSPACGGVPLPVPPQEE